MLYNVSAIPVCFPGRKFKCLDTFVHTLKTNSLASCAELITGRFGLKVDSHRHLIYLLFLSLRETTIFSNMRKQRVVDVKTEPHAIAFHLPRIVHSVRIITRKQVVFFNLRFISFSYIFYIRLYHFTTVSNTITNVNCCHVQITTHKYGRREHEILIRFFVSKWKTPEKRDGH